MNEAAAPILIGSLSGLLLVVFVLTGHVLYQRRLSHRGRKVDSGAAIDKQCYGRTREDWLFSEQIQTQYTPEPVVRVLIVTRQRAPERPKFSLN